MKHIFTFERDAYMGIKTGLASAFLLNEAEELLVNSKVFIKTETESASGGEMPILHCSVNYIVTDKQTDGLKRGYSMVFVSVICESYGDESLLIF